MPDATLLAPLPLDISATPLGLASCSPALVPMDVSQWLPLWITPFWVIGAGIVLGLLLIAGFYGLLMALSFVPGLGTLGDDRRAATIASAILAAIATVGLCIQYVPQVEPEKYQLLLVVPMALLGILFGWGIVYGAWHRTRKELLQILTEGYLPYVFGTALIIAVIGFAGTKFVESPRAILNSVSQVNLLDDGTEVIPVELPGVDLEVDADEAPFVKVDRVDYDLSRITEFRVVSDKFVRVADGETPDDFVMAPQSLQPGEERVYRIGDSVPPPVPMDSDLLYLQNTETDPATVVFTLVRKPQIEEAATIPLVGIGLLLITVAYVTFRQASPRVAAIAVSTAKSEMAQPLYLVLMAVGIAAILILAIVPFYTMGDDIKLMKDCSMTLIMIFALVQFVWSAGSTVSEEIDGRTALTVLSKPISRRGFLLGKYTGILMTVIVLFVILGAVLSTTVSYKPIYDGRETSTELSGWEVTHGEVMATLPPMLLYFMETMAIGAIAVALATRLPLLANFITCFSIYVVGNLTSPLVQSSAGENPLVAFVGKLIAVVVPNLNAFSSQAAIDAGIPIPPIYLAGALNYLVCFCVMIFMLALLLFEDRDLA